MQKKRKNSIVLIVASLILAVCLWLYIIGEESVEISKEVEMSVLTAENITVVRKSHDVITVVLSVPRNMLRLLEAKPISITHVIGDKEVIGQYSFNLKTQDVLRPSAMIKVKSIIPERIVVSLDKVVRKRLPIVANLVNNPAAGYVVKKDAIRLDPNAVLVSGAKSVLEEVTFVLTEPIDIIGRIRSFRKRVSLKSSSDYEVMNENDTEVYIPISEEFSQYAFEDVPILVLNGPKKNYEVTVDPMKVTFSVQGAKQTIDRMVQDKMFVYVDVVELGVGKYKLPLQLDLPQDITLIKSVPVIDVTIVANTKPTTSAVAKDVLLDGK